MKKSILNLGKSLSKIEQKNVKGGDIPCFEWCALDPITQSMFDKPLYCSCNTGGSGGSSGGGSWGNDGPTNPV